ADQCSDLYLITLDVTHESRIALTPAPTLFPYTTLFRSLRAQGPGHRSGLHLGAPSPTADPLGSHHDLRGPCTRTDHAPSRGSRIDRKSTRLNSSHVKLSYADFCLKKKKA